MYSIPDELDRLSTIFAVLNFEMSTTAERSSTRSGKLGPEAVIGARVAPKTLSVSVASTSTKVKEITTIVATTVLLTVWTITGAWRCFRNFRRICRLADQRPGILRRRFGRGSVQPMPGRRRRSPKSRPRRPILERGSLPARGGRYLTRRTGLMEGVGRRSG